MTRLVWRLYSPRKEKNRSPSIMFTLMGGIDHE